MSTHPLILHLADQPDLHTPRRIVVAVSGGPDSLALLHAFLQVRHTAQLYVFHLDHGLRGAESAADAQFVAACCAAWGVPCHCEQADIRTEAPHLANLSEAARVVRYQRLARFAQSVAADAVLVAHHRDDQAETLLMRLLRGSGLRGLAAMSPSVPWHHWAPDVPGGTAPLLRPLLDIDRSVIDDYITHAGLTPRVDPSNAKQTSFRVRMRTQHLPALRSEQPHLNHILATTARHMREADDFIQHSLDALWPSLATVTAEHVNIDRSAFVALHPVLQRAAARRAIQHLTSTLRGIDDGHIDAVRNAFLMRSAIATPLPYDLQLRWHGQSAILAIRTTTPSPYAYTQSPQRIAPGQTIALAGAQLVCFCIEQAAPLSPFHVCLRHDESYTLRTRQPGDRIGIGHGQHKRLQDVYVDAKIPAHQRATWPVLCAGDAVVWVVGVRVDPDAYADAGYRFEVTGLK